MEWYAYLISIPAAIVLGQAVIAFFSRPLRLAFLLRHTALARLEVFRGMPLPKPRHLATSSQDIRAYDQALRNLKVANCAFADLGAQFLALSESEPATRGLLALLGLNMVDAGRALINLSKVYGAAKTDSAQTRHDIDRARHAADATLATSRAASGHELIRIRLEPIRLPRAGLRAPRLGFATIGKRQAASRLPKS
jgi:hypothetical protein